MNSAANMLASLNKGPKWSKLQVVHSSVADSLAGEPDGFDLCEDCREVFLLQFMTGARIEAITKPAEQTHLPHAPMNDCMLVWNPHTAGFVCNHEDPILYQELVKDAEAAALSERVNKLTEDMTFAAENHVPPTPTVNDWAEAKRTGTCAGCKHEAHIRDECAEPIGSGGFCGCRVHTSPINIPGQRQSGRGKSGE